MNINKWLGLVSAASPYSLPPGALVRQNNIQVRKPGQLVPRTGMNIVSVSRSGPILGVHRSTSGGNRADTILVHRRNDVDGVDYTLESLTESSGSVELAQVFSTATVPSHQPSFCQDRHGTTYCFFGSGIRPQVYRRDAGQTVPFGMDAPSTAPTVTPAGDGFFVERVDVIASGTSYYAPPTLTVTGGNPDRPAKLRAVIQGGSLVAVDVVDGGSNYRTMPTITISSEQVGSGFLGRGNIASSVATYGFRDTDAPQSSTASYITGYTHSENYDEPAFTRIAYREPLDANTVTRSVEATFDASTFPPTYTALIPLTPTTGPWTTTATFTALQQTATVASTANIRVGTELQVSTQYFDSNPVVTAINSLTLTLDRSAKDSGTSVSVTIVQPSDAFARVVFNSLSSGWKLGGQTPTPISSTWTTASNIVTGLATMTVNSTSGITVGATLILPSGLFASNPVVTAISGTTVTVNQNAIASSTGSVNLGVAVAGSTTYTTDSEWFGGSYKYQALRANWYTTDDYFQNTSGVTGSQVVAQSYNRDKFWALMPSTNGYTFRYNQVSSATPYAYSNFFFPEYESVGVRILEGREDQSGTEANWGVYNCPINWDINGEPFIEVELRPMKKPITGASYATTAGTYWPIIKINLAFCPESWTVADGNVSADPRFAYYGPQMGQWRRLFYNDTTGEDPPTNGGVLGDSGITYPRVAGGALDLAKRWWSYGSVADYYGSMPVVDCRTGPDVSSSGRGLSARSVQIVEPGAQMERGTKFRVRLEQYNAYDYRVSARSSFDTWTYDPTTVPAPLAVTVANMNRNNNWGVTFTDFVFEATELDTEGSAADLLLPGAVNSTPTVVVSGSKWALSQDGGFVLRQQNPAGEVGVFQDANSYTFRAKELIPAERSQRIGDVTVLSGGVNYFREPTILVRGGGGYGLRTAAVINNGKITSVMVLDGGDGFTTNPTLYTSVEPAKVMPVLRGTMQGNYRCAYRFADYSQTVVTAGLTIATTAGSKTATLTAPAANASLIQLVKPNMKITGTNAVDHMTGILSVAAATATTRTITLSKAATATRVASTCVIRDMEQPIAYSDFSPIVDVDSSDSGANRASKMVWSLANVVPPSRADFVEFFRTSADQSLLFYRLEQYGTITNSAVTIVGEDTLSDEELFDFDRPNYAAIPVVLPNGNLNAYRFGVARSDMAACVAWQDRLWYGVSTSGTDQNTVFYSELDEFESCPTINELPIQNNLRSTDYLTALVPFGSVLLAMQSSHCYAVSYNSDPNVDATVQLQAHRGCLCQQAWDVFDDLLYVADERGIYRMSRGGDVETLSDDVRDFFDEGRINWSYRRSFFLKVDQTTGIMRFFYTPTGVQSDTPTAALCLHIANKLWWTESWPNSITSATDFRTSSGRERPVYGAADGNVYEFGGTRDYAFRDIESVTITNGGSGYITPPTVTAVGGNGRGAQFKALLTNGVVTEILITDPGYGYGSFSGNNFVPTVALSISASPAGQNATATAVARQPFQDMADSASLPTRTSVPWAIRTGPLPLATDATVKGGERLIDRSISVTYQPTAGSKTLILREYYNNSDSPRPNVMRRDRGTGWVHETSGARATLDMNATRSPLGPATGIAKAMFAGRSMEDIGSADRHLSVELSCDPQVNNASEPPEAVIYGVEVRGVVDGD